MQPAWAQTVDPIFVHVLNLIARIESGLEDIIESSERDKIRLRFEMAEERWASMANSDALDWPLVKYALVVWTDEVLIQATGRSWKADRWAANPMEMEIFGTNVGGQEYFVKSTEIRQQGKFGILEVYYLGVILGFQGFYGDNRQDAGVIADALGLPATRDQWAAQVAKLIGPSTIKGFDNNFRTFEPCEPLVWHRRFIAALLLTVLILCFAVATFWYRSQNTFDESVAPKESDVFNANYEAVSHFVTFRDDLFKGSQNC